MESKKINYGGLKKVLSPKELKNVIGGSTDGECMQWGGYWGMCAGYCPDQEGMVGTCGQPIFSDPHIWEPCSCIYTQIES